MLECEYILGKDYVLHYMNKNGKSKTLTIKHPKLQDIFDLEDDIEKYFQFITVFCIEPQDRMYELWDQGIDYEEIAPYELFLSMYISYIKQANDVEYFYKIFDLLFGIKEVNYMVKKSGEQSLLGIFDDGNYIIIDENVYKGISSFLKIINNIQNKEKEKFISQETKQRVMDMEIEDGILDNKSEGSVTFGSLLNYYLNKNTNGINYFNVGGLPMYTFKSAIITLNRIEDFDNLMAQINAGNFDSSKRSLDREVMKRNPMSTILKEEK